MAALGSAKAIWPAKLTPAKKAAPVPATRRAAPSKVSLDLASSDVLVVRATLPGRREGLKASTPVPEVARRAAKARDLVMAVKWVLDCVGGLVEGDNVDFDEVSEKIPATCVETLLVIH